MYLRYLEIVFFLFVINLFIYVYACMHTYSCMRPQRSEECVRPPGTRVSGNCQSANVDARHLTLVLCKSNKCS